MAKKNNQNLPQTVICPHCGERYSGDRKYCPYCKKDPYGNAEGYTPMSDSTAKKIRLIVGAICVVAFIIV